MAKTPWDNGISKNRVACDPPSLNMLKSLGLLIDAQPHLVIGEDERRSLADVLEEAEKILQDDVDKIPVDAQRYLAALIQRARFLVENLDKYGAETVRSVALELSGAMHLQADRAEGDRDTTMAKRWRSGAKMIGTGFMTGTSTEIGKALVQEGFKQIGGGG
ncbi:hypothetical protein K8W59_08950 [Nocardioides rotundus]|nr:hypothetical protein K8W59_08950 [Nocardioides rotundus]